MTDAEAAQIIKKVLFDNSALILSATKNSNQFAWVVDTLTDELIRHLSKHGAFTNTEAKSL